MSDFLEVFTFGQLEIRRNGEPVDNFPTRKVEALLVYLACTGKTHPREVLADFLWDERDHKQALKNLRSSLSYINQALSEFLEINRESIALPPSPSVWIDSRVLLDGLSKLEFGGKIRSDRAAEQIKELTSLYRGDFLHGFFIRESQAFDNWLLEQRQRINKYLLQALSQLVNYYLDCGEYTEGINQVLRLLELDPLYEEAHRQYMQLLAQTGQRSAALAQYEACRRLLEAELDAEPEGETTRLYEAILAGQSQKSIRPRYDSLPIQATKFLGRENELRQIEEYLANKNCRLLTLLGMGGTGKTRLAYQAAESFQQHFADGICFVSLAGLTNAEQVHISLAEALRFNFKSSKDTKSQLLTHLRDKELLIVFDNCEHLLDGMLFLSEILRNTAAIKILATSREELNLQAEWLMPIDGLEYPVDASISKLESYSAIELFVQTAQRIQNNYQLDNPEALLKICELLKGLPLALEMAAAWTRSMTSTEIAAKIQQDLDLLQSKLRDIPERHRSIYLLFEDSWDLLSQEEQRQFSSLAVFQGKISPEAVQRLNFLTIEQLNSLKAKSLVQATTEGNYRLHDLLRRYAYQKLLASGEADTIAEKHAVYFFDYVTELYQSNKGLKLAFEAIREDYDNISAALNWAYQTRKIDLLVQFIQRLASYWETRFLVSEAMPWIRKALEILSDDASLATQANLFVYAGVFLRYEPDFPTATAYLERGTAIAREIQDSKLLTEALHVLGYIQLSQGLRSEAMKSYEEQLAVAEAANDEYHMGRAYNNIGSLALEMDKLPLAREQLEKALLIYRKHQAFNRSALLCNLGILAYLEQDILSAENYFKESLAAARSENNLFNIISNLINLGDVAVETKNYAVALNNYFDAFETSIHAGQKAGEFGSLTGLAKVLAQQGKEAFATVLFAAVASQREVHGLPSEAYNQEADKILINELKAKLGTNQFEERWQHGSRSDYQAIIEDVFHRRWA